MQPGPTGRAELAELSTRWSRARTGKERNYTGLSKTSPEDLNAFLRGPQEPAHIQGPRAKAPALLCTNPIFPTSAHPPGQVLGTYECRDSFPSLFYNIWTGFPETFPQKGSCGWCRSVDCWDFSFLLHPPRGGLDRIMSAHSPGSHRPGSRRGPLSSGDDDS